MATVLLLGLEVDLADSLAVVLRRLSHDVVMTKSLAVALREKNARIVFAAGDNPRYREIVRKLTKLRPDAAVIIVNRFPENARWLDALELGATDYCGAPFEAMQVEWLMQGALRARSQAA